MINIQTILGAVGGLAFFLYGMTIMSGGLEKIAGGKLERAVLRMTKNNFSGFGLGALVTTIVQSSTAVTLITIGLVNAGIMGFSQSVSVIMGTNIGTTFTSWILSVAGISSDNILISLVTPSSLSAISALVGTCLFIFAKSTKKKDIGTMLLGFGILMFGMELMTSTLAPLAEVPALANLLTLFSNPVLGTMAGAVFTAIIQSSTASVGVLQALSIGGTLSVSSATPLILGMNIGTCVSALFSGIGANRDAKRVAISHLYFNIASAVIILALMYGVRLFVDSPYLLKSATPFDIAVIHTLVNLIPTLVLFPFINQLTRICELTIRDKKEDTPYSILDHRLLLSPALAVSKSFDVTVEMGELARKNVLSSISLLDKYSSKTAQKVQSTEQAVDNFEDRLGSYLVELGGMALGDNDSRLVSLLLHSINDFERICDHSINIAQAAEQLMNKELEFTKEGTADLQTLIAAITEILDMTCKTFTAKDSRLALEVEPLEQVIDNIVTQTQTRHITRLQHGGCSIPAGFIFTDLLHNFERISDHCSNIAAYIIMLNEHNFEVHHYMEGIKNAQHPDFDNRYRAYKNKYLLK